MARTEPRRQPGLGQDEAGLQSRCEAIVGDFFKEVKPIKQKLDLRPQGAERLSSTKESWRSESAICPGNKVGPQICPH